MNKLLLSMILLCSFFQITYGQVGINTDQVDPSAIFEVKATDKGILTPRVALEAIDNTDTPIQNPAPGLFIFNTTTSAPEAAIATAVSPGFYYFDGTIWQRIFNNGFALEFKQTAELMGVVTSEGLPIPGLDTGDFSVPFKGTYQIKVTSYYTAGDPINDTDAACQGDFRLYRLENNNTNTFLEMAYVTSESKYIENAVGEFNNLGNQYTLIHNIDLDANTNYRFFVAGSQWICHNTNISYFGKETDEFTGSNGIIEGQYGEMTITLVEQK